MLGESIYERGLPEETRRAQGQLLRRTRIRSNPVTGSAHRVNQPLGRIRVDLLAQIIDVYVDHVGHGVGGEFPDVVDDGRSRNIVACIQH